VKYSPYNIVITPNITTIIPANKFFSSKTYATIHAKIKPFAIVKKNFANASHVSDVSFI
jgi:hypothetical protein